MFTLQCVHIMTSCCFIQVALPNHSHECMCLMHGKGVHYVFRDCMRYMLYMSMCECTLYVA